MNEFIKRIKSKIRSLIFRLNYKKIEKIYKFKILKYYNEKLKKITPEEVEILKFLEKNPPCLFPYEFTKKYIAKDIKVFFDLEKDLRYTILDSKKLYFKRSSSEEQIKNIFSLLLMVQDKESPHKYLTDNFNMPEGNIVADIGAAEGDFSLAIIEKVKRLYIFESDSELIEALEATFEPWREKVIIINKYASDRINKKNLTLDSYFNEKELPNFIKIDVEGEERNVLIGAKNILRDKALLKIVIASYHRYNDEIVLRDILNNAGYQTEYSKGYMLSLWDNIIKEPYLRRGLIRATKI
jgi:hypothetical protein